MGEKKKKDKKEKKDKKKKKDKEVKAEEAEEEKEVVGMKNLSLELKFELFNELIHKDLQDLFS